MFPVPSIKESLFFIVYSWLPCWSIYHRYVGFFLGFLSCLSLICVCFCSSVMLLWLLWLYGIVWSQWIWFLQFCFSFSGLFWLLGGLLCFHMNFKPLVLVLWKMSLVFWQELHWFYRLLWIVWSLSQHWVFQSKNMVYLSICLCYLQFLSLASYSFWSSGLLPPSVVLLLEYYL